MSKLSLFGLVISALKPKLVACFHIFKWHRLCNKYDMLWLTCESSCPPEVSLMFSYEPSLSVFLFFKENVSFWRGCSLRLWNSVWKTVFDCPLCLKSVPPRIGWGRVLLSSLTTTTVSILHIAELKYQNVFFRKGSLLQQCFF